MRPEHSKEIERMLEDISCPKLVQCYYTGLKVLCRARDVGLQSLVECLEENPDDCPFSLSLSGLRFCKCAIRVYIAKNIEQ
jgi:hypothetical protein